MDLEQFYTVCNGSYEDVKGRLLTDERIIKFVRIFIDDPTYNSLVEAFETQNIPEAFRAAHTMKGLAGNLGFTTLYQTSDALTEALRIGSDGEPANLAAAPELKAAVDEAYKTVVEAAKLVG